MKTEVKFNIICESKEQREEIKNRLWKLKCRMYEKRTADALLKLLMLADTIEVNRLEVEPERRRI